MNLLPKTNLWVKKCVHVVRMISFTGPKSSIGASGSYTCRPPVDAGKKPVDSEETVVETIECVAPHPTVYSEKKLIYPKENVVETMACVAPDALPASEGNPGMPPTTKSLTKSEECAQETGEFLTRFYSDQLRYFRNIAKVNKVSMKRIIKLRRDWLKFCEKHF